MTKEAALQAFWSSFGLPAYEENSVPAQTKPPFITYEANVDSFGNVIPLAASIYYKSESWLTINAKEREISQRIGSGIHLECDDGYLRLYRGSPWATPMTETDSTIKRKYLNLIAEYLTTN